MRLFKVPGWIPLVYVLINLFLFCFLFLFGCFFPVSEISAGIKSSKLQIARPMWPPPTPTPPFSPFLIPSKKKKPVHIVSKWMKKVSHPTRQRIKNDHNMLLFTTSFFHSKSQLPIKLHKTYHSHLSMKNHSRCCCSVKNTN
jgi:hypothetical protein